MNPTSPPAADLDPNALLTAEFAYVAQCAFQANEDLARVTNLFLLTLGGIIAALLGTQSDSLALPAAYWAFAALFVALSSTSFLTVLQLVRLRSAWRDAVLALNRIKDYYAAQLPARNLPAAFAWQTGTVPPKFKGRSVSFLLVVEVAVLGGITAGAAVLCAGLANGDWWWSGAGVLALVTASAQVVLYRWLLR